MITLPHEKPIVEYQETIEQLRKQNKKNPLLSSAELEKMEKKLIQLKEKVYTQLTPWERVTICRHPLRPHALDYIHSICDEFEEIHGDRTFRDDPSIVGGFGVINEQKFVIIGQEKGKDTQSRLERNFGMPHPEGYRKALRLMKLAEKFSLPVITLIDTPGAYPGLTAEERGQGRAIAENLWEMAQLKTPIFVILIGEGCSGGALGIGIGDVIAMLEHSYYSVISPEGCASILWKDASKNGKAAEVLKMQAEDLLEKKIIDEIIKEPLGGAHHDPDVICQRVKRFILEQCERYREIPLEQLVESRYQKFRKMGAYTEGVSEGSS